MEGLQVSWVAKKSTRLGLVLNILNHIIYSDDTLKAFPADKDERRNKVIIRFHRMS